MPLQTALQRLQRLDRSSLDFQDQLSNILNEEEYAQRVSNLQGDDLVWLIGYLDEVRRHASFLRFLLMPP